MAPLPAALATPTPSAPKGGAAGSPQPAEVAPFAQLLGLAEGPSMAGASAARPPAPGLPTLPAGSDGSPADALEPSAEDALPAAPAEPAPMPDAPWPPAGLGGLFAAPVATGALASTDSPPSGAGAQAAEIFGGLADIPSGGLPRDVGGPGLPSAAPPAALAAAVSSGDAAVASDPDAGDTGRLAAARVAVDVDGADPAPPAFTLPQAPTPPTVRDAAPVLAAPVPTPDVRGGDFGERFGAQLQWMAGQNIGHARIQVTPHDLGPVEVMLRMDGDTISADFISAHAETRQALEQGLPRLRDLLGEHGFQLAHAGVGSDAPASQDGDRASGSGRTAGPDAGAAGDGDGAAPGTPVRTLRGLVDAYA